MHAYFGLQSAKCPNCRLSKRNRVEWGCDEPAKRSIFATSCVVCGGIGRDMNCDPCDDCKGTGKRVYNRCPFSQTDDLARIVVKAAIAQENGNMPFEGGSLEQSFHFDAMINLALVELKSIRAQADKVASRG